MLHFCCWFLALDFQDNGVTIESWIELLTFKQLTYRKNTKFGMPLLLVLSSLWPYVTFDLRLGQEDIFEGGLLHLYFIYIYCSFTEKKASWYRSLVPEFTKFGSNQKPFVCSKFEVVHKLCFGVEFSIRNS